MMTSAHWSPGAGAGPDTPGATAEDVTREVFSRPELVDEPSLIERFLDWLFGLFPEPSGSGFSGFGLLGQIVVWLIGIALIALIVALVVIVIRRWPARADTDDGDDFELDIGEAVPPSEWLLAAERAEADERWKDALLYRYRVLAGSLIERDCLLGIPGSTTGELRSELSVLCAEVFDEFDSVTRTFEQVWYGGKATGREDNAEVRKLIDDILERAVATTPDVPSDEEVTVGASS